MAQVTDAKILALVPNDLETDVKNELLEIWYALKNPHEITSNQVWPFQNVIKHARNLVPATHTEAGPIPITIATFLYDDIRQIVGTTNRLDIAASNMFEDDIKKYPMFWIELLYSFFLNYCGCEPSRTRNKSAKRNAILNCIYGPEEKDA